MLRSTGISTKHTGHGTRAKAHADFPVKNFIPNMKFTWIYILYCTVVVTTCGPTTERPSLTSKDVEEKAEDDSEHQETLEDLVDLGNEDTNLPILPPIILIDFTNGTNLTSEEKSKRTINGNLGYGFQRNNIFSGKYNYYFPAGKTGTTVSIEESISPFLPTTIIEKVNSHGDKIYSNTNSYSSFGQSNSFGSTTNGNAQSQIGVNEAPLVFGQRTKLQKSTADNFQSFSRFTPTQNPNYAGYPTPKPHFQSNEYSAAPGLGSYGNPTSIYQDFSTPRTPIYNPAIQGQYNSLSGSNFKSYDAPLQSYGGIPTTGSPLTYKPSSSGSSPETYGKQGLGLQSYSNPTSQSYSPPQSQTTVLSPLGNSPKYSYENGVKYEHKIVWKYPNGMVSDIAPNSYDGIYSEYSSNPTKESPTSSFQSPGPVNNYPKTISSGYSVNAGSIYSQKPATFPDNGTPSSDNSKPNQFVSSASISNGQEYFTGSTARPSPPSQKYSFQNPYSVNGNAHSTRTQANTPSPSSSYDVNFNKANTEDSKLISDYPVDSPEAEYSSLENYPPAESYEGSNPPQESFYTYSHDSPISNSYGQTSVSNLGSTSGKTQSTVLSKYTPQAQQYLKKALGLGERGQSQKYETSKAPESFSNIQYSNLLDYNPSISQYVRDPSSILNAQPTFVQAGNSLIPVIILRVDGVAPIQPKITPNINLKALLQKYLTQYAQTVNNLSQGKNYDQSYGVPTSQTTSSSKLFDIGQLAQSLGQFGSRENFKQNFAQSFAQSVAQDYQPNSFSSTDGNDAKYLPSVTRESSRKPKVKNVQIIDDPRFTSYKVKN